MGSDELDENFPSDADGDGAPTRCVTCRTRLDQGVWHPTVGHTDSSGTYRIVRFCNDECREEWRTSREEPDEP